jgi:hypothetical protein
MARRKPPSWTTATDSLPAALRPENVTIEQFVPRGEQPPARWFQRREHGGASRAYQDGIWREITALRRRQGEVRRWGAERDLNVQQLREMGLWPGRPPGR